MSLQEPIQLAESPVLEGQQIENWCIEKKLGEGGMSIVYLARHMWLSQYAAIKLLRPEFCRDVNTLHRFQQEALAASRLQHENIIEVKDFGRHPEIGYFMILEKLDGVDLDGMMEQTPLPKSWILGIARQVCSALNATHKAGIVHRDLKPSNIFLLPDKPFPKVKLLDFGVAKVQFQETAQKLTSTGMIVGTPAYLAPEQVVPQGELTPSADIYALGVVLYNMFTGRLPIFAENAIQHVIKVLQEEPTRLGKIRPELAGTAMEDLIMQMLSKSPHLRPQSMGEVWTKLHEAGAAFDDPLDRERRQPDIQLAIRQVSQKQEDQEDQEDNAHGFITAHFAPAGTDSFDNLPEAGPVIALPTGSIAFAATSDFPTFQKEQPHLQHAQTINTSTASPRSQTPNPKIWMGLSAMLVLVLCVFTGWWVTGASSSTHNSKRHTQETDGPSQLNQLVIKGYKALKKGNFKTAAHTWKRVMKQKDWRKSSHFPQLYKAMGIAYQGQKRLNHAVRYFDRYVSEVKNLKQQKTGLEQQRKMAEKQGNKKQQKVLDRLLKRLMRQMPSEKKMQDELKEIATVRSHLQQQGSQAERMLSRLQNHLDQDEWKKARQLFERLKKSLPSHPKLQAQLGSLVAKQFPHLAMQSYRDILENAEPKDAQRQSLLQNINALQQRVTAQKQSFQKLLQETQAYIHRRKGRKAQRWLKQKLDPVRWLTQPFAHRQLQQWLHHVVKKNTRLATKLWKIYIRKQKKLEQSGRLAWGQDKTQPTAQSLQKQLKAMTVYGHIQQVLDKAHRIQQKGNMPRAIASYQKAMKLSASLEKIDRWHYQKKLSLNPRQIHTRWKRLKLARQLQHRGNRLFARAAFERAQEVRQQMLKQLSLSPARTSWKERIVREQRRAERAQKTLERGDHSFRRRRWKSARHLYQAFLKQFPHASQRKRLQQKIKTCSCGIGGVPWLDCSREKAYIRRVSKGRR